MKDNSKNKNKQIFTLATVVILLLVFAVVCATIYQDSRGVRQREDEEFVQSMAEEEISLKKSEAESENITSPSHGEEIFESEEKRNLDAYEIPENDIDFEALKKQNEDVYAWLRIPGTNIDYPILQHPAELDYYLHHNLDGSAGYPGCIYSQLLNSKDFDDFNTVLYGHNMTENPLYRGTMFARLHDFEDSEFFEEHPYIYVYTEDGSIVYEVFAAYEFTDIHLLLGFDLQDAEIRQIYIDNIFGQEGLNCNFNTDVEVGSDSKILSLSTCVKNKSDKRYIVAAVMVADGRKIQ